MKDLTYIQVKEGKLLGTDREEPNKRDYLIDDDGLERYAAVMEAFNQSFIEVGNPDFALGVLYMSDPQKAVKVSGLQFEVRNCKMCYGTTRYEVPFKNSVKCQYCTNGKVAILSLKQEQESWLAKATAIHDDNNNYGKQEQPSEEKEAKRYTVEEISSRLKEGLSKFGCKSTIAGKWILEDNIYHVLRELKD